MLQTCITLLILKCFLHRAVAQRQSAQVRGEALRPPPPHLPTLAQCCGSETQRVFFFFLCLQQSRRSEVAASVLHQWRHQMSGGRRVRTSSQPSSRFFLYMHTSVPVCWSLNTKEGFTHFAFLFPWRCWCHTLRSMDGETFWLKWIYSACFPGAQRGFERVVLNRKLYYEV